MGFWEILEKLFKRKTEEVKPYVEKDTKCDKCEILKDCIAIGNFIDCTTSNDSRSHYIGGCGSECKKQGVIE